MKTVIIEPKKCIGYCEEHRGKINPVKVYGNGWAKETALRFDYCEAAIQKDIDNGFTVEIIDNVAK